MFHAKCSDHMPRVAVMRKTLAIIPRKKPQQNSFSKFFQHDFQGTKVNVIWKGIWEQISSYFGDFNINSLNQIKFNKSQFIIKLKANLGTGIDFDTVTKCEGLFLWDTGWGNKGDRKASVISL